MLQGLELPWMAEPIAAHRRRSCPRGRVRRMVSRSWPAVSRSLSSDLEALAAGADRSAMANSVGR